MAFADVKIIVYTEIISYSAYGYSAQFPGLGIAKKSFKLSHDILIDVLFQCGDIFTTQRKYISRQRNLRRPTT